MAGNLRQTPPPRIKAPPRVQDQHKLGQLGGLWCCLHCHNIYTHAKTRHQAEQSHAGHLTCVTYHREHRDEPDRYL